MRLDVYLVQNKYYDTRSKSKAAILTNCILVNNIVMDKPNYDVKPNDRVSKQNTEEYVSRGAYKLLGALQHWNIDLTNKVVLDIGASTGGFTDVAIKRGANKVYAIDVGTDQLHKSLLQNPKVFSYEQTHLKDLQPAMFKEHIDVVVADLSFISLTKLMDKLITLFNYQYHCIFLIKPEFELSAKEIDNGKVKTKKLLDKAINKIKDYAESKEFKIFGVIESPIKGNKAGNTEYLIHMEKK